MKRSNAGLHGTAQALFLASCLFSCLFLATAPAWAAERFFPETECTSEDRGPYPWDYQQIVEGYIQRTFFDPGAVIDLDIYKPAPGWWSTATFKMTRRNTKCYWYIAFQANGKNRMGGYVGRKTYGLWVKDGVIKVSQERSFVDQSVVTQGKQAFTEELEKLSEEERQAALALSQDEADESPEAAKGPAYLEELRGLAALRDEGVITDEEFEAKKAEILGLDEKSPE